MEGYSRLAAGQSRAAANQGGAHGEPGMRSVRHSNGFQACAERGTRVIRATASRYVGIPNEEMERFLVVVPRGWARRRPYHRGSGS